jgi:hypothetical protein
MKPNVITLSGAARAKGCERTTIHRAIERGELHAADIGGQRAVLKDAAWGAWQPQETGARAAARKDSSTGAKG